MTNFESDRARNISDDSASGTFQDHAHELELSADTLAGKSHEPSEQHFRVPNADFYQRTTINSGLGSNIPRGDSFSTAALAANGPYKRHQVCARHDAGGSLLADAFLDM